MSPDNLMEGLLVDLQAETADLLTLLSDLDPADWSRETPAVGWTIRDQVSHLAFFDDEATLAAADPDRFELRARALVDLGPSFPDVVARRHRHLAPEELLSWFARSRQTLVARFARMDPRARVPWFGPSMSVLSSATARLMETWAHGQDIAETVGVQRVPTDRLRHVADLGVRTTGFAHVLRGLESPTAPIRVELTSPAGATWSWGDDDATDRVSGSALDFCLKVTQRRHLDDTDLVVTGPAARTWMFVAQAFAGAPGPGREAMATAVAPTA